MTETSKLILEALRTTTISDFTIVYLIPAVLFVYAFLVSKQHWSAVFGGLAFFAADVFNELVNTVWLFVSGYAPLWGTPKVSATGWLLLPGWCWEIMCMFAIGGVPFILIAGAFKPGSKFLGLYRSQWLVSLLGSLLAIIVEVVLNRAGLLTWEWAWWGKSGFLSLIPVFIFGYFWFFYFAFLVHNQPTIKRKFIFLGSLVAINLLIFSACLCRDWII